MEKYWGFGQTNGQEILFSHINFQGCLHYQCNKKAEFQALELGMTLLGFRVLHEEGVTGLWTLAVNKLGGYYSTTDTISKKVR